MQRKPRQVPSPYLTDYVTRSPQLTLLALALSLRGAAALLRMAQRLQWLLFDFKPLNHPAEAIFLAVTQGTIFAGHLITLLTALAVLCLRMSRRPGRGRMLYRMANLLKVLYTLGALLTIALTGAAVFGAVHYRLPAMWIAIPSAIGVLMLIITWTGRMFYKNIARVMVDLNHSLRRGQFQRGRCVSCHLRFQSWLLAMTNLIPIAIVILWGVISVWFIQSLRELFGSVLVDRLMAEFAGSFTSPGAMYGLEILDTALAVLAYALTALLYARYARAHDERVPTSWLRRDAA